MKYCIQLVYTYNGEELLLPSVTLRKVKSSEDEAIRLNTAKGNAFLYDAFSLQNLLPIDHIEIQIFLELNLKAGVKTGLSQSQFWNDSVPLKCSAGEMD